MPNANNELQIVEYKEEMKDAGLTAAEAIAFAQYDTCRRPCVAPPTGGKSFVRMAEHAIELGIEPSQCLNGIRVKLDGGGSVLVPCPYGANCHGYKEALRSQ